MARGQLTVRVLGDTKPFERSVRGIGRTLGNVAKIGAAAFAAAGAGAVTGAFKVASFGDEVAKSAQKAGLATEPFQELRFAFGQGGVEAATFDTAMQKFNKRLGESATTGGTADGAFESLGVALRDANGNVRDAGEAMDEVLPRLAEIESDAERAAVAGDLFGQRAGPELAAALSDGAEGIDEARAKAQELGIVMDGDAAEAAEKFTDQWGEIKQSVTGLLREGLTPLMVFMSDTVFPALQTGIGRVRELWSVFQEADGVLGGVQAVFADLFSGDGGLFDGLLAMVQNAFDSVVDWLTSGGLDTIFDAILEARERMFEAAMRLFPVILDALIEFVPQLLDFIATTMIPGILEQITTSVPRLLEAAVTMFQSLVDAVIQVLPGLLSTLLGEVLPAVLETVLGMIPQLLDTAVELFTTLVDAVVDVLPSIVNILLTEVLPNVLGTVLGMVPQLLDAAVTTFLALVDAVLEVLPELINVLIADVLPTVIGTLLDMIPELLDAAIQVFTALVEAIPEVLPQLVGIILTDLIPAVIDAVMQLVPKMFDAGVSIIQGLIDGAGSLLSTIGRFFLDKLPGWIRGPFERALGISSPSKVFARMGEQTGEGFVQGLEKSRRMVSAASGDLARMAEAGANVELRGMAGPSVGVSAAASRVGSGPMSRAASRRLQPIVIVTQVDGRDVARSEAFWDQAEQRLVRESRLSAGSV